MGHNAPLVFWWHCAHCFYFSPLASDDYNPSTQVCDEGSRPTSSFFGYCCRASLNWPVSSVAWVHVTFLAACWHAGLQTVCAPVDTQAKVSGDDPLVSDSTAYWAVFKRRRLGVQAPKKCKASPSFRRPQNLLTSFFLKKCTRTAPHHIKKEIKV